MRTPTDAVNYRLSRPSLAAQYPVQSPLTLSSDGDAKHVRPEPIEASLAYPSPPSSRGTNVDPFILSPILNLPPSFGSAYVGESFRCTLCANNEVQAPAASAVGGLSVQQQKGRKQVRDVRIEAEMKTPGSAATTKLPLSGADAQASTTTMTTAGGGTDLGPGETLQRIVDFDLTEEGNHVLAVTVSYYEATETSGRTRTFRKLYQFMCKTSLIVRTKVSALGPAAARRWVMEAQLENCSDEAMQLERCLLELDGPLRYSDCNWGATGAPKPVLQPGEVEQVCFIIEERVDEDEQGESRSGVVQLPDGRVMFGKLGIAWRGEMGNRGFLSTGKLSSRVIA